jgi:hypothetical protein
MAQADIKERRSGWRVLYGHNPKPPRHIELPPELAPNGTTLLELKRNQCRWPCSSTGLNTIFCGDRVRGAEFSYCERHYQVADRPAPPLE